MRFRPNCAPLLTLLLVSARAFAQQPDAAKPAEPSTEELEKQRVLGVLPNYRTAQETGDYTPISARRKFYIGLKDSSDYPVFLFSAALAGLGQISDSHPRFGQGMQGFGRRYGATLADQVTGNLMTESLMPVLFHQDPRYFRLGAERGGGVMHRFAYAVSRVLITKTDHGNRTFNFSEIVGNSAVAAVGNAYYPGERTLGDNAQRFGAQVITDALSQVLKEFWPDIRAKLKRK